MNLPSRTFLLEHLRSRMHWQTFHWIAGGLLALAWFSRIVEAALGMPRVADIALPAWDRKPATPSGDPRVSVIVPARNEEESIGATLRQLLVLDYSNYEIIAVNDRSTDRTGAIMDEVFAEIGVIERTGLAPQAVADRSVRPTRLRVIHVSELPSGWLGKTHAMWTAGQQATGIGCYLLMPTFCSSPTPVRRAVAYAEAERADHVVLFPRMIMKGSGREDDDCVFSGSFCFWTPALEGCRSRRRGITWGWVLLIWSGARCMTQSGRILRCAWKWSMT